MRNFWLALAWLAVVSGSAVRAWAADDATLAREVLPLLKTRCVKCHGPAKQEAKLDLSTPGGIARGGEDGPIVAAHQPDASLVWQRITADEMPPDDPLSADEKALVRRWITAGAPGLGDPATAGASPADHWSFRPLVAQPLPDVRDAAGARTRIDRFILARLESEGLTLAGPADPATFVRRVSFDLTGLPPTPEEVAAFLADHDPEAYEKMVDRYLASPHYGQRWGKYWLDAAGYADSNGYFNADTDRPLAYRYRDWVVRAINDDKPFDRFVVEQLAGDELSGFVADAPATPEMIALLEASHFVRNGPDGTGESDGNPDELRVDRYNALEAATQVVASSLLGLTMQCAKCHDHKFEPLTQRDYYQLQSVFYPVFNIDQWVKPNERFVHANLPGEVERWQDHVKQVDAEVAALKAEYLAWAKANRPPSVVLFHDEFDDAGPPLSANWSQTAPGDDVPGGTPSLELDAPGAPAARRHEGGLEIVESGAGGDRWLSTRQAFDWTPDAKGEWMQVTFDLVDDKVGGSNPAERVAYLIGLGDFNDNGPASGGNVLFDGNPAGGAAVHVDYPGDDAKGAGELGKSKYQSGHNYGVRITNVGENKFRLDHLVDWLVDDKPLTLPAEDLTDGGFGFEYCCGRSFKVDNVLIERSAPTAGDESAKLTAAIEARHREFDNAIKDRQRGERPGKISCALERSENPPEVFLLERGNYAARAQRVEPAPLTVLARAEDRLDVRAPFAGAKSTGRRLAWARWLTEPGSRQAALFARVQVNRIWQHHFGTGIVATTENLGTSGAAPSHPELLDDLANQFVRSGWSAKAVHRLILNSAAYRQTSRTDAGVARDPANRLLWRYPVARLDAESIRDAMLAASGSLDRRFAGPYVPTDRNESGEVIVNVSTPGAARRSLFLQQRRTQTLSMLNVFDAPSMVFNCPQRTTSTMPLQSLSLLNSPFAVEQAGRFAERIEREAGGDANARVARAFLLAVAHDPAPDEAQSALAFVDAQRALYAGQADGEHKAWCDFCQMLLASSEFLYVD